MKRFLIISLLVFSLGSSSIVYSAGADSAAAAEAQAPEEECPICLNILNPSDGENPIITLSADNQCGHSFHTSCFQTWMERGNRTCPLCRTRIDSDDDLDFAALGFQVGQDGRLGLSEMGLTTIAGLRNFGQKAQVRF